VYGTGVCGIQKRRSPLARAWSSFWFGKRGKNFRAYREQDYFFLEAFFLPFFFALAMLALQY
jgi:hypothetical protein